MRLGVAAPLTAGSDALAITFLVVSATSVVCTLAGVSSEEDLLRICTATPATWGAACKQSNSKDALYQFSDVWAQQLCGCDSLGASLVPAPCT